MPALGYIAYEGPSMFDGAPIAVIINKIHGRSANAKTGGIVQSFIIRTDVPPVEALQTGQDAAVCGDCRHRPMLAKVTGDAPCYVQVGKSVASVYKAYLRGRYQRAPLDVIARALTGRILRIGTYGDGAMAPAYVWQSLTVHTAGHRGYTHQWAQPFFDAAAWAPLAMASVDTLPERDAAKAIGMRTFRVSIGISKEHREATCPASTEGGRRLTCEQCTLCAGTSVRANDVVIADHAVGHKRRITMVAA